MDDEEPALAEAMKQLDNHLRNMTGGGAAKADGAGTVPSAATPPQQAPLPIDWSTEGTPAYANGMHILHRATEFALLFTDMAAFPGRLSSDGRAGNERAAVVASLRIAPDAFFQMLCVMASNWNRYIGAVTDARMRQPRFKLIDAGDMQLDGVPAPKE